MEPRYRKLLAAAPIVAIGVSAYACGAKETHGATATGSSSIETVASAVGTTSSTAASSTSGAPTGHDDWPELGHDPGRTYASSDPVAPPFEKRWTWTAITKPGVDSALNTVSIGGEAFVQLIGKASEDAGADAGTSAPSFASVALLDGTMRGIWSAPKAFVDPAYWLATTPSLALVDVDGCDAIELASLTEKFACGDVDGKCQKRGSIGEVIADAASARFFATNREQRGDPKSAPSDCLPPANVSAYDLATGAPRWTALLARYPVRMDAHLALGGSALLVAASWSGGPASDGSAIPADGLHALDVATGKELWMKAPPSTKLGRITTDGKTVWVVARAADTRVLALDLATGATLATSDPIAPSPAEATLGLSKTKVIAFLGGSLVAIDRATGKLAWSATNLLADAATNGLAISDPAGVVYITTTTGIEAYRVEDGTKLGALPLPNIGNIGHPILARGLLLVTATDAVVALGG